MSEQSTMNPINKESINSAMSYDDYNKLINQLFEEGKTTGDNQSEAMLEYAKMNIFRMKRLDKTAKLSAELESVLDAIDQQAEKMTFLVITEGWCGDAAQNLPVINKIASYTDKIELKLILRDENLEIMDAFLTNGGRSIPKLIALKSSDLSVLGTWGPRPQTAQQMVQDFKKIPDGDYSEFVKEVQLWYAKDKTLSFQGEITPLLQEWNTANNK